MFGIEAGEGAVHHNLRDGDLAAHVSAARLEIDGVGETALLFLARFAEKMQTLGRALRMLGLIGHDALPGDRFAGLRRQRGQCRIRRGQYLGSPALSCPGTTTTGASPGAQRSSEDDGAVAPPSDE